MLVETKAKVGVFAIALGAYLPQFPTLVPEFEAQYDAFKKTIPDIQNLLLLLPAQFCPSSFPLCNPHILLCIF